jgi:hypothetical protein
VSEIHLHINPPLTNVRSDHEQVVVAFQQKKRDEQKAIDEYQKQLDAGKQVVLNERATNRLDTNKLRNERAQLEAHRALVQRDREKVQQETQELHAREQESKRNRHVSRISMVRLSLISTGRPL